jgi:D-alanine--poly(phosphoribitol) ligase subunit 1
MEVTQAMLEDTRPIPIGIPLNEVRFAIVDEAGNELPEGKTGELLIISDSVSAGYFGRPDLTAQRFFEWKGEGCVKRGYRTGDAVYRLGQYYYFCGRIDFQVKLNGYRIELEDIENNMMRVTNVARAVVLPVSKEEKIDHLVAFVMLQSPSQLSALKTGLAIKEELKQYLPSYMIPRKIVLRESFPINTNGKVDRKQLALELK